MVLHKYKLSSYGDTKRLIGDSYDLHEPILFREKLSVFDENGNRIGRFSLNIDQEDKIFYVHISNRALIDGKLSESTVTGTVTHRLRTLEEIRYESTEVSSSGKHERCLFLLRERTKYYISVTNTVCDFKTHSQSTIPFVDALGLIGESANAVLMRKLATKGYEGILCLKTVLSNGKRCKNYYVTKLSQQVVNGQRMEVLIIYRNITNHRMCNITMTLALTRAGQIIYLFWSNSKCFLHIDPDVQIYTHFPTYADPGLENHWQKDVQLYSLYLDMLDSKMMQIRSFTLEREELVRILGDFIEFILLSKPDDPICFAIQYFSAFSRKPGTKCRSEFESNFNGGDNQQEEPNTFPMWMGEGEEDFCGP